MMIVKRICPIHGLYMKNKKDRGCPQCRSKNEKIYNENKRDNKTNKIYQSKRWKDLRIKALIRDNFCCVECKTPITIKPRDHVVDHIIEIKDGGKAFDLNNLQSLCMSCHNKKTNIEKRHREGGSENYRCKTSLIDPKVNFLQKPISGGRG